MDWLIHHPPDTVFLSHHFFPTLSLEKYGGCQQRVRSQVQVQQRGEKASAWQLLEQLNAEGEDPPSQLGVYLQKLRARAHAKPCPQMLIAAVAPIAESRNKPNSPPLMMDRYNVVCSYDGILPGNKEQHSVSIHRDPTVRVGEKKEFEPRTLSRKQWASVPPGGPALPTMGRNLGPWMGQEV